MRNFESIELANIRPLALKCGGGVVTDPATVHRQVKEHAPTVLVVSGLGSDCPAYPVKGTDSILRTVRRGDRAVLAAPLMEERHQLLLDDMVVCFQGDDNARQRLINDGRTVIDGIGHDLEQWEKDGWPVELLVEQWATELYGLSTEGEVLDARRVILMSADGRLDMDASEKSILDHVDPDKEYVMAGCTGAGPTGEPHTLGRGGSDVSPVVIGRGLLTGYDIGKVIVASHVPGIFTDDPRVNPDASLYPVLDCRMAERMMLNSTHAPLHPDACRLLGDAALVVVTADAFAPPHSPGTIIANPITLERIGYSREYV